MKLYLGLAIAGLCLAPAFAADEGFLKHWSTAKELTLAVADAMPAVGYSFKPNPDEMSFGEQMVHIANANYNYCTRITGGKSPFKKPETIDKSTAVKLLGDSFDYCTEIFQGVKDPDAAGKPMTPREVMLGAYAHMAHHRGQAEVYLRVKGIKPPQYKF